MDGKTEARVLMVNDRFFSSYENKIISTAWSLAGAKLFLDGSGGQGIEHYEFILNKKGYKTERRLIKLCGNEEI